MSRSICESLLDVLAEAGARDIFGVTGDVLNPLLEAIRTATGFTQRPAKYTAALLARWPSIPALRPYLRHLATQKPEPKQLCLL